ncbi:VapE domain-containing protein [Nitrosomonas sp.]|uniref:VapE domain-containing protein n=1 Tax=Nitrosomonas sp. TaxID=42353 RepID=UPI0026164B9A|nr:VapE domain-containing protein [Nitrosomonas sp.]
MDISNQLVDALMPLFVRVRTDVYWEVGHKKNPRCVKKPLTEAELLKHVSGGPRCGVSPIDAGSSVTFVGLLDFDSHKGETEWIEMLKIVKRVISILRERGCSPIPFKSSGGMGVHIYLLWDFPQDAYSVRNFLRDVLHAAGLKVGTRGVSNGEVEIFPKQDAVAEGKFGSMFILPFGGRSCALDPVTLRDIDKANVSSIEFPVSIDVPEAIRPKPQIRSNLNARGELKRLSSALGAISYEGTDQFGYDRWLKFVLAIHHASGGSEEGRELTHEFFSRADEYNGDEIDQLWEKADSSRVLRPVTAATIYRDARQHGWIDSGVINDFEDLTSETESSPSIPSLVRNDKGVISNSMDNITKGIACREICKIDIAYDTFRDEIVYSIDGGVNWMPFKDADYTRLRINLERYGFKSPAKENIRDAVLLVADNNKFDTAQDWLNQLPWDGIKRVEMFLSEYIGTEDTPYHRAVSRYLWTAMAGRILSPGCKADMVLVLAGKQGTRKSSAVAALSPDPMFFTEISFNEKDDDLSRKIRGRLIAEIAELKGLHSKEEEHIKAFITKQIEDWIPKYKEFKTIYPRRIVFIGTTNREDFLSDETGNRRWLPVQVNDVIDVDRIIEDRLQLWAEAREMFKADGVDYKEAEKLAIEIHAEHMVSDPWEAKLASWLKKEGEDRTGVDRVIEPGRFHTGETPSKRSYLLIHEVLVDAIGFDLSRCGRSEEMRMGRILRKFGYQRKKRRINGQPTWVYVPTVPAIITPGWNSESP